MIPWDGRVLDDRSSSPGLDDKVRSTHRVVYGFLEPRFDWGWDLGGPIATGRQTSRLGPQSVVGLAAQRHSALSRARPRSLAQGRSQYRRVSQAAADGTA